MTHQTITKDKEEVLHMVSGMEVANERKVDAENCKAWTRSDPKRKSQPATSSFGPNCHDLFIRTELLSI
jgi:hypothetical protein